MTAPILRDNWQDIGGDRFVQATQNGLIESMNDFSYPDAYGLGNVGRNTFDRQRFIDCQFSASKEWRIKERATATFRFDFQNPFKWYNLSAPNTTVNFTNPATFGKVSTSTGRRGHHRQRRRPGADEYHPFIPLLGHNVEIGEGRDPRPSRELMPDGHLIHDFDAEAFQRHDLSRMIGQQPDRVQTQVGKNLRTDPVLVL